MANGSGQVALLIDFENLVRGLGGSAGKERVADILEPGFLFNLAEETHDSKLSSALLAKYQSILWQAKSFTLEPDQGAFPLRERMLRLRPDLLNLATFVASYERSILFKARQAEPGLDRALAATLLGLSMDDPSDLEYCDRLLTEAEAGNGCAASDAPQAEPQLA
jgi:hypothetical protein